MLGVVILHQLLLRWVLATWQHLMGRKRKIHYSHFPANEEKIHTKTGCRSYEYFFIVFSL